MYPRKSSYLPVHVGKMKSKHWQMMLDNSVILSHKQTSDMPRHKQKVVIKTVEVK